MKKNEIYFFSEGCGCIIKRTIIKENKNIYYVYDPDNYDFDSEEKTLKIITAKSKQKAYENYISYVLKKNKINDEHDWQLFFDGEYYRGDWICNDCGLKSYEEPIKNSKEWCVKKMNFNKYYEPEETFLPYPWSKSVPEIKPFGKFNS